MQTRETRKYGGTMRLKTNRVARAFVLPAAMGLLTMMALGASGQDIKIAYEKFVLPNGLTVIVHEDHKAPIVALNIWYHVGSKNEKPGKTGFAHLFEHLMFGGSENLMPVGHGFAGDEMPLEGVCNPAV